MSITDELRKWGRATLADTSLLVRMEAIADRIDAEHESACAEAYGNGVMSVPIALDESAWVELPKDADGVPWNVGDCDEDGNEVTELRLTSSGWCVLTDDEWPYRPERHRHYHAPTVENVLREFTDAILEWSGKSGTVAEVGTWSDVAAKYAKRLTLAEVEDA